jgi:tryptophan synthase alpha chain
MCRPLTEQTADARSETKLAAHLRGIISEGGKAFAPYVTGGLFGVTAELLEQLEAAGADAIEVGVPFSDPIMDGGVVQEASRRALEAGFHPRDAFELVAEANLSIPVVLMTYLNPVFAMGVDSFIEEAIGAGVSGTIIPDMPEDEGDEWIAACSEAGLATIFLAAPGTSPERLTKVAEASTGFVYCVTTYGVTGARETLAGTSRDLVEDLRKVTDRPLLVGVGISTPEHAHEACTFADGVIVGSALVKPMLDGDFSDAIELAKEFRAAISAMP